MGAPPWEGLPQPLFGQSQCNLLGTKTIYESTSSTLLGVLTNILESIFHFCRIGEWFPIWTHAEYIVHVEDTVGFIPVHVLEDHRNSLQVMDRVKISNSKSKLLEP